MAITEIVLTDVQGTFDLDAKDVTLQWLVVSDSLLDFAVAIAKQGTLATGSSMIDAGGNAAGWLPPGSSYALGNERWRTCYAGPLEVSDRKIIAGTGNFEINGITFTRIGNNKPTILWKVRQRYATENRQESLTADGDTSTEDRVTIKMSNEFEDVPFTNDLMTGLPILNSAGQPFNPPAVVRRKIPVYSLSRREIWNPLAKAKSYTNTVNADAFYGAPPYTLLMDSLECSYDGQAWNVTYNIKERLEGWQTILLDTGYYERTSGGKLRPILEDDGTPVSEPAKLDGQGKRLSDQTQLGANRGPYFKYQTRLFNVLNLPNPFNIYTIRDGE